MDNPYIHGILFPCPMLEYKYVNKYKENIIHIPTKRKLKEKDILEKIPCFFKKNSKSKNILIIFHGNGSNIFNLAEYCSDLSNNFNINILVPEYPGYSIYDAPHDPDICLENTLIIYDYILNNIKNFTEKNIYIFGRSLGACLAIYLSSKRNPAGTFLISPFTTFAAVGNHDEGDKKILEQFFRSIDYIDKIKTPLLIIHGKIDPLVNYNEAIKLYEKCGKDIKKEIKIIDDMAHNFMYEDIFKDITPYITVFVDKYCPLNNSEKDSILIDFDKELYNLPDELKKELKSNGF